MLHLLQLKRSAILVRTFSLEVFSGCLLCFVFSFFHLSYMLDDTQWLLDCNNICGRLADLLGVGIQGGIGDLSMHRLLQFAFPGQVDA